MELDQLAAVTLLSRIDAEIRAELDSGEGIVPEQYVVQGWLLNILNRFEEADAAIEAYGRLAAQRLRDLGLA